MLKFTAVVMKYFLLIGISFILSSCGLLYEPSKPVNYKSQSFSKDNLPLKPDFQSIDSWAVHPNKKVDILADFEVKNLNLMWIYFLSTLLYIPTVKIYLGIQMYIMRIQKT